MFYLQNFKNFAQAELDDEQPVTLLVGPNGAGKSNLIEAVEMLAFLAAGHPLYEITDLGREGGLEVRGGLEACASFGQNTFTLGYKTKIATAEGEREVHYEITVRVGKEPRIVAESLHIQGRDTAIFEVIPATATSASADNEIRYDNHARGRNKIKTSAAADRSALSQYPRFATENRKLPQTLMVVDRLMRKLKAPEVFDPVPKQMREFVRDTGNRLARNGFNISPVLQRLCSPKVSEENLLQMRLAERFKILQKERSERIMRRIAQLPDEPFQKFDFITPKTGDVMFGFKTTHSTEPVTARVLSDGTLRALAILTALETSSPGQHLVLEEFDNGVHPSRTHILGEALFECAKRNGSHVLATTHNPATLNALTTEQLDSVLLVVPDAGKKFARLLPIKELPGHIEFLEQGRLGDLITRRIYERHLVEHYEENRQESMNQWVESLP